MLAEKFFAIAQVGHEVTLWVLIIMSVISVAFIIERFFLISNYVKKSAAVSKRVQESIRSASLNEIEDIAKDRESIEGRALSYGVRHTKEHGAKGLDELFTSIALQERPVLEKRLNFLATVGSNAPFIGLLGTVLGIMDAFRGLANSSGEIQGVMAGISSALVATAVGLLVAIPAVIAYNYFQKRVKQVMQSLDSVKHLCLAYAKTLKGGN